MQPRPPDDKVAQALRNPGTSPILPGWFANNSAANFPSTSKVARGGWDVQPMEHWEQFVASQNINVQIFDPVLVPYVKRMPISESTKLIVCIKPECKYNVFFTISRNF